MGKQEELEDYITACVSFAKDTEEWAAIDRYKFYLSDGNGWYESCDGNYSGLDVSWAFQLTEAKIRAMADKTFEDNIRKGESRCTD